MLGEQEAVEICNGGPGACRPCRMAGGITGSEHGIHEEKGYGVEMGVGNGGGGCPTSTCDTSAPLSARKRLPRPELVCCSKVSQLPPRPEAWCQEKNP